MARREGRRGHGSLSGGGNNASWEGNMDRRFHRGKEGNKSLWRLIRGRSG